MWLNINQMVNKLSKKQEDILPCELYWSRTSDLLRVIRRLAD